MKATMPVVPLTVQCQEVIVVRIASTIEAFVQRLPGQQHWAWHTPDVNKAKVWRRFGQAREWIRRHREELTGAGSYGARVVDPRMFPAYVGKP